MPFLSRRSAMQDESGDRAALIANTEERVGRRLIPRDRWIDTCANPNCRSGWLHLWRSHAAPIFEGGWTCSAECTHARVAAAVAREVQGRGTAREAHRHRVPLGLLMLEKGWITSVQLRKALDAQKAAGTGRIGEWLIRQRAISEEYVTRALGLQWSCPVLSSEHHDPAAMAATMPRLFVDAFGVVPLRMMSNQLLYLGFEAAPDPVLALAVERISGARVETGIVAGNDFKSAHRQMLVQTFPGVELIEAVSPSAAAYSLARSFERARPGAGRLVRVHECLWLRMWERAGNGQGQGTGWVRDVICSLAADWRQ